MAELAGKIYNPHLEPYDAGSRGQDFKEGKMNRRQLLQALGLTAGAASVAGSLVHAQQAEAPGPRMRWMKSSYPRSGPFKTLSVNHISYSVPDQRKARAWYIDLLGMQAVFDNGRSTALRFGIPWNHIYLGQNADPKAKAAIGHMAYAVGDFRLDAVEAELKARGLVANYDGPEMIHTDDPEGYRCRTTAKWLSSNLAVNTVIHRNRSGSVAGSSQAKRNMSITLATPSRILPRPVWKPNSSVEI